MSCAFLGVFACLAKASAKAFTPPIFVINWITPPISKHWRIIPAFQGSDMLVMICFAIAKNAFTALLTIFKSVTQSINSPMKIPINSDKIVSLVINANAIATSGGNNVKIPNLAELFPSAGICVIDRDNTKRPITQTAVIIPIFILLLMFINSPFFKKNLF